MAERKPKAERQAKAILKIYMRRGMQEAAHRAGVCGCARCKVEPQKFQEWMDTPPEKS